MGDVLHFKNMQHIILPLAGVQGWGISPRVKCIGRYARIGSRGRSRTLGDRWREKKALYFLCWFLPVCWLCCIQPAAPAAFSFPWFTPGRPACELWLPAAAAQHQVAIKKRKWHSPDISIHSVPFFNALFWPRHFYILLSAFVPFILEWHFSIQLTQKGPHFHRGTHFRVCSGVKIHIKSRCHSQLHNSIQLWNTGRLHIDNWKCRGN